MACKFKMMRLKDAHHQAPSYGTMIFSPSHQHGTSIITNALTGGPVTYTIGSLYGPQPVVLTDWHLRDDLCGEDRFRHYSQRRIPLILQLNTLPPASVFGAKFLDTQSITTFTVQASTWFDSTQPYHRSKIEQYYQPSLTERAEEGYTVEFKTWIQPGETEIYLASLEDYCLQVGTLKDVQPNARVVVHCENRSLEMSKTTLSNPQIATQIVVLPSN